MFNLEKLFKKCMMNFSSTDKNSKELIDYIKKHNIEEKELLEFLRKYIKILNNIILIEIIKNQTLTKKIIEEFKEYLYWEDMFIYQYFTFEIFVNNKSFFDEYDIIKRINENKIKITNNEKKKLITYFNMIT